ncbi:MAG: sulfotransferase family 2 domain-containing protein [Pseudolabrys sp.]
MANQQACLRRLHRYLLSRAASRVVNWRDHWLDPAAESFYRAMSAGGFNPEAQIDVLPQHRLIYVCVPKSASTTIKSALSTLERGAPACSGMLHKRRYSGLKSPSQVGLSTFHQLASNAATLRFSFVRNPYARLVSAWADKYQNKPLLRGDSFADLYLTHRAASGDAPAVGDSNTLSFPRFVEFAAATADRRVNAHWHLQDDILDMPGIKLDLIGKVENFPGDFNRVLDHVGASDQVRLAIGQRLNASQHHPWQDYYTDALAARVHGAYERDFDRFGYSRALNEAAA